MVEKSRTEKAKGFVDSSADKTKENSFIEA
jgi:hypothetical protein